MRRRIRQLALGLTLAAASSGACLAEQAPGVEAATDPTAPRVFLDCPACDFDFVRTEITFINYARERQDAQVHILVTSESTGAGGAVYTLDFEGQQDFAGVDDTLTYTARVNESDDDTRRGLTQALRLGLLRYLARTPLAQRLEITVRPLSGPPAPAPSSDRWNSWVFNVGLNAYLSGEQTTKSRNAWTSATAARVTPDWKVNLSLWTSSSRNEFELPDTTIVSSSRSRSASALVVKSLGDHWSAGATAAVNSSTYSNIDLAASLGPALEYNFFPYADSTRRQLRLLYALKVRWFNYTEETIYFLEAEQRLQQSLTAALELHKKWGAISAELVGSNYLHDFGLNRLVLSSRLRLNLVKGLSFDWYGYAAKVHDQLSLPRGGATLDEILLRRRELETSYEYWMSVGLSYSFGATYNNVVNPRFGE